MKPLRTVILGCGAVSNLLYHPALSQLHGEVELVGVADLNRDGAAKLLQTFRQAKFFTDYIEMFVELQPDAAIVALPHFLHKRASVESLSRGIHVFCEKPMAMNSAECDEIEMAVGDSGRVFAVNLFRRLFPSVQQIRRIVAERALGRLTGFEISEGAPYAWPAVSPSFFDRKTAGGGVLIDSGVHTLDLLQWWLGEIEVIAFLDDADPQGVECDCVAELSADGARGSLRMSRSAMLPNVYRLEFEGGWIEWDHDDGTGFRFSMGHGETVKADVQCASQWSGGGRFVFALGEQLRRFAKACRGESTVGVVGASDARRSVDTVSRCYAARKSLVIAE